MTRVADQGHYVSHMKCYVLRVSYDFALRTGEVWMPVGNCTDMDGAVEWFGGIDDGVKTIITLAGGNLDTTYIQDENGEWRAAIAG